MIDKDKREALERMAKETIQQLRINMKTQRVWPKEVYPRYKEINKIREKYHSWFSTGEGYNSFSYEIRNARLDAARVDFFFNEYLRFAELGVGAGRPAEDVERTRKAKFRTRYSKWGLKSGKTHRPSIMMEFRHLQRRIAMHWEEEYGYSGRIYLMEGLKGWIPKD